MSLGRPVSQKSTLYTPTQSGQWRNLNVGEKIADAGNAGLGNPNAIAMLAFKSKRPNRRSTRTESTRKTERVRTYRVSPPGRQGRHTQEVVVLFGTKANADQSSWMVGM